MKRTPQLRMQPPWFTLATAAALVWVPAAGVAQQAGPTPGSAEVELTISVPDEGEHLVRFLPSADAKQPAQLPIRFLDRTFKVKYKPTELGSKARIAVDNVRSGISAIRPLAGPNGPRNGVLDLKATDFDHVRELDVKVSYQGKPVSVAKVTLEPRGEASVTRILDPAKDGIAVFEDIPMGRARVTVIYGDGFTQAQDVDIAGGQAPGPLVISVAVANRVPTVEQTSPSAESEAGDVRKSREQAGGSSSPSAGTMGGGGGLAGWLGTLLGLAIGAGAIYLLYRWSLSGGMAATLKKVGIEVSGPQPESASNTPWQPNAPPPPVVSDPTLCQFCGQKKDAAGNCACSALPSDGAVTAPSAVGVAQPRLIGTVGVYSGAIFTIDGTATIGREPTNTIALPNDNTVSRRHATLRADAGAYVLTDEGSSNGTFVNGVRITGSQPIRPGDEVQIGNTRFRFEV